MVMHEKRCKCFSTRKRSGLFVAVAWMLWRKKPVLVPSVRKHIGCDFYTSQCISGCSNAQMHKFHIDEKFIRTLLCRLVFFRYCRRRRRFLFPLAPMQRYHYHHEQAESYGQGKTESQVRAKAVDDEVDCAHGHHNQGDLPADAPERMTAFIGGHDADHGKGSHETAQLTLEKNQAADHSGQDDDLLDDRHLAALARLVAMRKIPHHQTS